MSHEDIKHNEEDLSNSSPDQDMKDSDESSGKPQMAHFCIDKNAISKKIQIMHLNSLSSIIGNMGISNPKTDLNGMIHEIIFHSPHCPLPINSLGRYFVDNTLLQNNEVGHFHEGTEMNREVHSEDSHCHHHKEHEKAFCTIFD